MSLCSVCHYYAVILLLYCLISQVGRAKEAHIVEGFDLDQQSLRIPPAFYDLFYSNINSVQSGVSLAIAQEKGIFTTSEFGISYSLPEEGNAAVLVLVEISPRASDSKNTNNNNLDDWGVCDRVRRVQWVRHQLEHALVPASLLPYWDQNQPREKRLLHFNLSVVVASDSSAIPSQNSSFCADCLMEAVGDYNEFAGCASGAGSAGCITSVFFESQSAIRCHSLSFEAVYDFVQKPRTFIMHAFDAEESRIDWEQLLFGAKFNRGIWEDAAVYPLFAVQWRQRLPYDTSSPSTADSPSTRCFAANTSGALGVWRPYGGWTLWGQYTQEGRPSSWQGGEDAYHVLLLLPSTSLSAVGAYDPGADAPVSGLVAALALADALVRRGSTYPSVTLDVAFLPVEWAGGVGSESLFRAVKNGEAGAPQGIQDADVVFVFDQIGSLDAPLYYHVDERVNVSSNAALAKAVHSLAQDGARIRAATTTTLPHTPISRYIDAFPSNARRSVLLTFARYDTTLLNPHAFSPSDRPGAGKLSTEAIVEAANIALRVIVGEGTADVDRLLVDKLWYCLTQDLRCPFITDSSVTGTLLRPDFSAKVFTPNMSATERALATALQRVGLETHAIAALPEPLHLVGPEHRCWEWVPGAPQTAPIWGEVLFSSSSGLRMYMVDGRQFLGWAVLLLTLLCGALVFYYTRKLIC